MHVYFLSNLYIVLKRLKGECIWQEKTEYGHPGLLITSLVEVIEGQIYLRIRKILKDI